MLLQLQQTAKILHNMSGGHPRSIVILLRIMMSSTKIAITEVLRRAISSGVIMTSEYCIRAAIIGKPVKYDMYMT
jgi:hypothetical protein